MDPLSMTGLTVALLNQLFKVGVKAADIISTYRDFDKDSKALEAKIRDENIRTRALHMLLFEPSSIYGGNCLFEQFDVEVQQQIQDFLEQATVVLTQACQLLTIPQPARDDAGVIDRSLETTEFSLVRRPGSFSRLRWSFRDKKRLGSIIANFADLNSRIHENIKLWCLGTSIGVNLQHLKRLEADTSSRVLGLDLDAKLCIATTQPETADLDLEIRNMQMMSQVAKAEPLGSQFAVVTFEADKSLLIEYRSYAPDSPVPIEPDDRTRSLLNSLANLLQQPKDMAFRAPFCEGWVTQMQHNRAAFIFSIPEAVDPTPVTLLQALSHKDLPPASLSQRFQLALILARCISQLQLVQWVHKSFRSENILFFPSIPHQDSVEPPEARITLSQPWVLGFEHSRPDPFFSDGRPDISLNRDIYRHPERQQKPSHQFTKLHDIYALGVVLLEIGLWQPVLCLEKAGFAKVKDPYTIQRYLIRQAERRLGSKAGDKYKEVVLKCLQSNFGVAKDTKEDLGLQQAFRSQVIKVLQRAADSI